MDRLFVKLKNDDTTLTAYFYGKDMVYVFDVAPDGIQLKSFPNTLKTKRLLPAIWIILPKLPLFQTIFRATKTKFCAISIAYSRKIKPKTPHNSGWPSVLCILRVFAYKSLTKH